MKLFIWLQSTPSHQQWRHMVGSVPLLVLHTATGPMSRYWSSILLLVLCPATGPLYRYWSSVPLLVLCPATGPPSSYWPSVTLLVLCAATGPLSRYWSSIQLLSLCPTTGPLSTTFVDEITTKASQRLYFIILLKRAGIDCHHLINICTLQSYDCIGVRMSSVAHEPYKKANKADRIHSETGNVDHFPR